MKVLLSLLLTCSVLLGFAQERETHELPAVLNHRVLQLPKCELPRVNPQKDIRIYRVKAICVFTSEIDVPVIGSPAQFEGLVSGYYKSIDSSGWFPRNLKY